MRNLLTDPLWQSATGRAHVFKLLSLATSEALQGHTADAQAFLQAALDALDSQERGPVGELDLVVAIVRVLTGETTAALDWAQGVLEDPESIPRIDPLSQVLLAAGERRQVEALPTASLERGSTVDLRDGPFVQFLVAVGPDNAASLASAEAAHCRSGLGGSGARRIDVDDRSGQMAPGGSRRSSVLDGTGGPADRCIRIWRPRAVPRFVTSDTGRPGPLTSKHGPAFRKV